MAKAKAKMKGVDSSAVGEPLVVFVEMARGGGGQAIVRQVRVHAGG